MKTMVFDVPAVSGGALTILKQYYENAVKDGENKWCFVISTPELAETKNVKVLRFPWVKKSWLYRLYFDYFIAYKIVEEYQVDEVLSLQNVIVPRTKVLQTVYLHQPLPFVEKRFKLTESPLFWMYQNIIGRKILKSIQQAKQVIVQTNWMKDACIKKTKVKPEKIVVISPKIDIKVKRFFEPTDENLRTFFYPASGYIYKNHQVIVDAAMLLKVRGINDYRVIFTLKGDENRHITRLYRRVKENGLPIEFIGPISQEQVFSYYSRAALLFPSYIETFGLPMLEARLHKAPVIASDCSFSREILSSYEDAYFFDQFQPEELAEIMRQVIAGKTVKNGRE